MPIKKTKKIINNPNQKEYYVKVPQNGTSPKNNKTINTNIQEKKAVTIRTEKVIDQYKDLFTFRSKPVSGAFIERLSLDLINWAFKTKGILKISKFIRLRGIPRQTFYDWVEKFPDLKLAKDEAMYAIGDRREIGALRNKLNASVVLTSMRLYDPEWKQLEQDRNDLKIAVQKNQASNIKYTIVVDNYKDEPKKPE